MTDENPDQSGDFTSIDFPTDSVTIGKLRRLQPWLFTEEELPSSDILNLEVIPTCFNELILAHKAFCAACGQPDPHPDYSRRDLARMLNDDYCRLGLSTGPKQTNILLRGIEAAAGKRAKGDHGHSR